MISKSLFSAMTMLALLSINTAFATDKVDELVGHYACTGNDPAINPSAFTGDVVVTKEGKQYVMSETDRAGNVDYAYNQFAIRQGNQLAMAFQKSNDLTVFGAQHMRIKRYGKADEGVILDGVFAYWNKPNQLGTEHCQKVS